MRRNRSWISLTIAFLVGGAHSAAGETVGTLTLDSLSFVSFQDEEVYPLAAGSTLQFHFGTPAPDGSFPFTISPMDVAIEAIDLPGGGTLQYNLAGLSSGTVEPTPSGRKIKFNATIAASLTQTTGPSGTYTYAMPLSTESVASANQAGTDSVAVTGLRLVDGVWYVQLVGATVNKENAFPKPGTAVYTVLSGQFDQMP